MRNPFAKPKPNPKRDKPRCTGDRVRLKGEAMTELRRQAFERSGGRCEAIVKVYTFSTQDWRYIPCGEPITWETMELSHIDHGSRKTDTLDGVTASCKPCHRARHNAGGKPVPRKAGRTMNQTEALAYWKGTVCFCGGGKYKETSFCQVCLAKVGVRGGLQLQFDVLNATGKDWLQAMALAEQSLLAWKPAEEIKA